MRILVLFFALMFSFSSWGFFNIPEPQEIGVRCGDGNVFVLSNNSFELTMKNVSLTLSEREEFKADEIKLSLEDDDIYSFDINDNTKGLLIIYSSGELVLVISVGVEEGPGGHGSIFGCEKIEVDQVHKLFLMNLMNKTAI